MIARACSGLVFLLAGCTPDESPWSAFNGEGESVEVAVTASDDLGDPVSVDLFSTTGAVPVGTGTVNPGSGPVGTDHDVTVIVEEAFEGEVLRVTVETDAGDRGVDEHELIQDSAEHGLWWRSLTSSGEEGEERTDTFMFHLWSPAEATDTDG